MFTTPGEGADSRGSDSPAAHADATAMAIAMSETAM
jgi:hypothetical protein